MGWPTFPPKPHESPDCSCRLCWAWGLYVCARCKGTWPDRHKAHRIVKAPTTADPSQFGWICDECYAAVTGATAKPKPYLKNVNVSISYGKKS